jgi:GT2 family glycosyltransferase
MVESLDTLGKVAEGWSEMKTAVLMLCYNQTPEQLELTKDALASVLYQDAPSDIFVVDNGSTDGETWKLLDSMRESGLKIFRNPYNVSPIMVANVWSKVLFEDRDYDSILGIANDVILPPNLLSEMLKCPRGIVTASQMEDRGFPLFESARAVSENTPMAVMLTRRWVYDALVAKDGYFFDEGFFNYASDCDLALRLAVCGIRGVQLDMQYYHYGSASHRLAPPESGAAQRHQADADRAYFEKKWGFRVDSLEYGHRPADPNFRG